MKFETLQRTPSVVAGREAVNQLTETAERQFGIGDGEISERGCNSSEIWKYRRMALNIPVCPTITKAEFHDLKVWEYEGGKCLVAMSSSQSQPMEEQVVTMASLGVQNEVFQRVSMFCDASRNLVQRK